MSIAIFTDNDGRVTLRHYKPELLPQDMLDTADAMVDSEPDMPSFDEDTEKPVLYLVDGALEWQIESL